MQHQTTTAQTIGMLFFCGCLGAPGSPADQTVGPTGVPSISLPAPGIMDNITFQHNESGPGAVAFSIVPADGSDCTFRVTMTFALVPALGPMALAAFKSSSGSGSFQVLRENQGVQYRALGIVDSRTPPPPRSGSHGLDLKFEGIGLRATETWLVAAAKDLVPTNDTLGGDSMHVEITCTRAFELRYAGLGQEVHLADSSTTQGGLGVQTANAGAAANDAASVKIAAKSALFTYGTTMIGTIDLSHPGGTKQFQNAAGVFAPGFFIGQPGAYRAVVTGTDYAPPPGNHQLYWLALLGLQHEGGRSRSFQA